MEEKTLPFLFFFFFSFFFFLIYIFPHLFLLEILISTFWVGILKLVSSCPINECIFLIHHPALIFGSLNFMSI